MGLDVSAKLLIGVHLEPMTASVEKTKYNPDTGVPYKVNERRDYHVIEGTNIEINTAGDGENQDLRDNYEGDAPRLFPADSNVPNSWFIGIVVVETESNRYGGNSSLWRPVPDDIEPSRKAITTLLQARFGYTGPIKLFVISRQSY